MLIEDPCGQVAPAEEIDNVAAGSIVGQRVGVLDNGKPNAGLLLEALAAGLADRGAILGWSTDKGAQRNAATAADERVLARLGDEVDVVLTGSGD